MAQESVIEILPSAVAERIAAGEVIERPASVVKELVENSLDADAQAISVEIRSGGLALIRVSDDGSGMSRRDVPLAITRFATSKLRTVADLDAIQTLGFRGEALSSIAAVAQIEIVTRTAGEIEGTHLRTAPPAGSEDGETLLPAASPVGTSVVIHNLFYNTPARRKFLKSPTREIELIRDTIVRYALAYPSVAWRLVVDGRERFAAPPSSALERIGVCLGRDVAAEMLGIGWEADDLRVSGFISRPSIGRSRRQGQFFYLNGRPIRSGLLAVMLERPYAGRLPPGRYPLAVVHISLNPHLVDVNVHPRKAEVRFAQERAIYQALARAVKDALAPFPRQETFAEWDWPFEGLATQERNSDRIGEMGAEYVIAGGLQALGQILYTYLVARSVEGLVVVDQHAAHEQILYERLAARSEPHALNTPVHLDLTAREAEILRPALPILSDLGFEIEPFGGDSFLVRALPLALTGQEPADLLTTLIEELHHLRDRDLEAIRDGLTIKAACTSALKAGNPLSPDEQQALLNDLMQSWSPATCPHGRPAFVTLTKEDLERRFLRR
jgi:DNA mismatch repair protein MutL